MLSALRRLLDDFLPVAVAVLAALSNETSFATEECELEVIQLLYEYLEGRMILDNNCRRFHRRHTASSSGHCHGYGFGLGLGPTSRLDILLPFWTYKIIFQPETII